MTKEKKASKVVSEDSKHVWIDPDTHYRLDCIKSLKKCGTLASAVTFLVGEYISKYPEVGKFIEDQLSKKKGDK